MPKHCNEVTPVFRSPTNLLCKLSLFQNVERCLGDIIAFGSQYPQFQYFQNNKSKLLQLEGKLFNSSSKRLKVVLLPHYPLSSSLEFYWISEEKEEKIQISADVFSPSSNLLCEYTAQLVLQEELHQQLADKMSAPASTTGALLHQGQSSVSVETNGSKRVRLSQRCLLSDAQWDLIFSYLGEEDWSAVALTCRSFQQALLRNKTTGFPYSVMYYIHNQGELLSDMQNLKKAAEILKNIAGQTVHTLDILRYSCVGFEARYWNMNLTLQAARVVPHELSSCEGGILKLTDMTFWNCEIAMDLDTAAFPNLRQKGLDAHTCMRAYENDVSSFHELSKLIYECRFAMKSSSFLLKKVHDMHEKFLDKLLARVSKQLGESLSDAMPSDISLGSQEEIDTPKIFSEPQEGELIFDEEGADGKSSFSPPQPADEEHQETALQFDEEDEDVEQTADDGDTSLQFDEEDESYKNRAFSPSKSEEVIEEVFKEEEVDESDEQVSTGAIEQALWLLASFSANRFGSFIDFPIKYHPLIEPSSKSIFRMIEKLDESPFSQNEKLYKAVEEEFMTTIIYGEAKYSHLLMASTLLKAFKQYKGYSFPEDFIQHPCEMKDLLALDDCIDSYKKVLRYLAVAVKPYWGGVVEEISSLPKEFMSYPPMLLHFRLCQLNLSPLFTDIPFCELVLLGRVYSEDNDSILYHPLVMSKCNGSKTAVLDYYSKAVESFMVTDKLVERVTSKDLKFLTRLIDRNPRFFRLCNTLPTPLLAELARHALEVKLPVCFVKLNQQFVLENTQLILQLLAEPSIGFSDDSLNLLIDELGKNREIFEQAIRRSAGFAEKNKLVQYHAKGFHPEEPIQFDMEHYSGPGREENYLRYCIRLITLNPECALYLPLERLLPNEDLALYILKAIPKMSLNIPQSYLASEEFCKKMIEANYHVFGYLPEHMRKSLPLCKTYVRYETSAEEVKKNIGEELLNDITSLLQLIESNPRLLLDVYDLIRKNESLASPQLHMIMMFLILNSQHSKSEAKNKFLLMFSTEMATRTIPHVLSEFMGLQTNSDDNDLFQEDNKELLQKLLQGFPGVLKSAVVNMEQWDRMKKLIEKKTVHIEYEDDIPQGRARDLMHDIFGSESDEDEEYALDDGFLVDDENEYALEDAAYYR